MSLTGKLLNLDSLAGQPRFHDANDEWHDNAHSGGAPSVFPSVVVLAEYAAASLEEFEKAFQALPIWS